MSIEYLNVILQESLHERNYNDWRIDLSGKADICDGHLSDINFINVYYELDDGKTKHLQLAVKKGKESTELRDALNLFDIFKQEVCFYEIVFPTLLDFQRKRKIENIFNPIPKCYKTVLTDEIELIILQNLKAEGYSLSDRSKPLSRQHLELALWNLGKFHALSYALADQEPKILHNITDELKKVMMTHLKAQIYIQVPLLFDQLFELLYKKSEYDIYYKLKSIIDKGHIVQQVIDLMNEETPYAIINHGDCWINNLMFQYKNEEKSEPTRMSIIDWQLTTVLNSSIYDLSFLLYVCSSVDDLKNLQELLDTYYNSLSIFIEELGSNPKEIFPYEVFLEHWRRYSLFGFVMVPMMMKFLYIQSEDLTNKHDANNETHCDLVSCKIRSKECDDRLIGLCKSYLLQNI